MSEIVRIDGVSPSGLFAGSSVAFGVFDGVHRGHRFLIDRARGTAAASGGRSVVLTFSIDPDEVFAADRLVKLMGNEERIAALAATGVDAVAVLEFTREFASLSPAEFLERTFGAEPPSHLHVGEGFRFGCRGSGDVAFLEEWGSSRGMRVHCHDLYQVGGLPVSSTRIRALFGQNKVEEANLLLGCGSCAP